ncbi:aminoglycoside phosphotransferase family protein [Saccharothrix violaceirubra]|uniref:Aminoglycoside phosphotransferase n=1 Tax=Saccharothrix violaceirubra TaxID=413306 RepID=A0A7W7T8R1_9PSEU|nr:aminoglycoside phosphotransferase family protein [Saccharothrix violaceirubra]MBB4968646.1 aminoglycoside phosphotransferase [Saccharothrix violaceirubra]
MISSELDHRRAARIQPGQGNLGDVNASTEGDATGDFSSGHTGRALRAACEAAGLNATGASLIRTGENALYALADEPIVVRIARTMDYMAQARKEVLVSDWLQGVGFPAVRVADVDNQPLSVNGHPVTFWQFIPGGSAPKDRVDILAQLLRRLHSLQLPSDRVIPQFRFGDRVKSRLEKSDAPVEDVTFLLERFESLAAQVRDLDFPLDPCIVHGDAHMGNVMLSDTENPILIDLENVGIGQPEWDLTVAAVECATAKLMSVEKYGEYVEAYGFDVTRWSGFDVLRQIQEIKMTTWLMQNIRHSREILDEFSARVYALRNGHSGRVWRPF